MSSRHYPSKRKRSEELSADESADVRVAMTYEHKGYVKTLGKSFHFTKSYDGEITTSNFSFDLIEENGGERMRRDGLKFDYDLPSEIRKYTMFKGESDLDAFCIKELIMKNTATPAIEISPIRQSKMKIIKIIIKVSRIP